MSWYNNWGNFTGDLGSILHGRNPANQPAPSPIPPGGPSPGGMSTPGSVPPNTPSSGPQLADPAAPGLPNGSSVSTPATDPTTGGGGSNPFSDILGALETGGKDVLGFLTGNGGSNALGLAGIAEAALRDQQAMNYAKGALSSEQDLFNNKAPLRALGIAGMQNVRGNPFATTNANIATGPTGPTTPGTPGTPGTITGQIGNAVSKLLPNAGAPVTQPYSQGYTQPPRNPNQPLAPVGPNLGGAIAPMQIAGMQ